MVLFSVVYDELMWNIRENRDVFIAILNESKFNLLYQKLGELVSFTGSRHKVMLQLHFPNPDKLQDIDSYGRENISVVIDKFRKKFLISKEAIRDNALKSLDGKIQVLEAYAYEGKEGLRVLSEKGRIEILPGSFHVWCKIDHNEVAFLDWMMENNYFPTGELGPKI
jgi:hypothetical protein